jgi:dihydrodipicolinate synthase/N-acetylneuraminate lyase
MSNNYEGIFPIALTTFDEQYEIDEQTPMSNLSKLKRRRLR